MRNRAGCSRQLTEVRAHTHFAEARGGRVDSQHRPEDLDVRAGAPGVAIGARRTAGAVDRFGERRQTAGERVAPLAEAVEIGVALTDLRQRLVDVELEEQPGLGEAFV